MIPPDMSPITPQPEEAAVQDTLDRALHHHFHAEPEPADESFSHRVLAALPAQPPRRRVPWGEWVQRAQWAAMSAAGAALAVLHAPGTPLGAAEAGAACALIGLLVFWSLPLRWARG